MATRVTTLQANVNKIEIVTSYTFLRESKAGLEDSYFNDLGL